VNRVRQVAWSFIAWCLVVLAPRTAHAQWYTGLYLGANHTQAASVTIDQPPAGRTLTFHDVRFDGRPFESPQYYGWRLGRWFGADRRLGLEFEFIHLKVIGRTDGSYSTAGLSDGEGTPVPMRSVVQRYAMTHGLNFAVMNLVMRTPIQGPFALTWRAGFGPTVPHAETTVDHEPVDQYEYGGLGAHLSAGVQIRTWRALSTLGEYKFTLARPRIDVASGTGVTTAATHQVAFGLAIDMSR
jgi:lipid A oxidase